MTLIMRLLKYTYVDGTVTANLLVKLEELDMEVDVTELEREPLSDPNHEIVKIYIRRWNSNCKLTC